MNLYFDINGMREAHNNIRNRTEAEHFLEYAGAEGLLLGGWYPDLAEKMYGKEYGAQENIINEMTKGTTLLPEETNIPSIREREHLVLEEVNAYVSEYRTNHTDTSRVTRNEKHRFEGKQPTRETLTATDVAETLPSNLHGFCRVIYK